MQLISACSAREFPRAVCPMAAARLFLSPPVAGNLTGCRNGVAFGASENGVSFGRYTNGTAIEFVALSRRTFGVDNPATLDQFRAGEGLPNAYPKVGPVVINELMYHPV